MPDTRDGDVRATDLKNQICIVGVGTSLPEGPRLTTNIVGIDPDKLKYGMPLTVVFDDVTPEVTLAKFKPA